jgi:predicted RNA-binding Zn-ribbon protein involved in translation (DUF1610 family)
MAYIDVDEFEYVILNEDIEVNHKCTDLENYVNGANQFRQQMKNAIRKQPTADVAEVKHGEWVVDVMQCAEYSEKIYFCSACRNWDAWGETEKTNYCPNCGAKMDGGKAE